MNYQTTKIVLLEFPDEVDIFLDYCQRNNWPTNAFTPVALQPSVKVYCRERYLECQDTLPFFDNDSHTNALYESHRMMKIVDEKLDFTGDFPLKNTLNHTFSYYYRFYINNYLRILEILNGIKEKYPNSEIYAVKKNPEPQAKRWPRWGVPPFLSKRDRFIPNLAAIFCREHGMTYIEISETTESKQKVKARRIKSLLSRLMRKITRMCWVRKLRRLKKAKVVFFAAPSYNLERLCDDIVLRYPDAVNAIISHQEVSFGGFLKLCFKRIKRSKGARISIPLAIFDHGPQRKEPPRLKAIREIYREFIRQNGDEFVYNKCALQDELSRKVECDLSVYLYYLCRLARGQSMILENLDPKLVVSPVAIEFYQAWGELGQELGIPCIIIPQKGLVAPSDPKAQLEEIHIGKAQVTDDFNYAASQSPLVSSYLKWVGYKGTVMETANLIFSKVDIVTRDEKRQDFLGDIWENKKVMVYAPSMKSRKSCRFYVLESLDELVSSLTDVVAAVEQMPDFRLIIRLHPGEPITRKEIEALIPLPLNVSISDKGSFEEVLTIADLVISYSSTIIQESLLNGVPVVLFDKWKRYNHLDAPRMNEDGPAALSSSYYVDDPEILASSIKWVLKHHTMDNRNFSVFKDFVFPSRYAEIFFNFVCDCFERKR